MIFDPSFMWGEMIEPTDRDTKSKLTTYDIDSPLHNAIADHVVEWYRSGDRLTGKANVYDDGTYDANWFNDDADTSDVFW